MIARWPALAPFRTSSFRYQWPADLCTAWALEMETLILGWYVLVESGSVVQLTLFGALMTVGTLLSPLLVTLGDRSGLRRVLAGMRTSYALLAGVILALAASGHLRPTGVLAVAFLVGPSSRRTSACARHSSAPPCPRRIWWQPWASRARRRTRHASAALWPGPASWRAWAW
jgi:hypothetical protein